VRACNRDNWWSLFIYWRSREKGLGKWGQFEILTDENTKNVLHVLFTHFLCKLQFAAFAARWQGSGLALCMVGTYLYCAAKSSWIIFLVHSNSYHFSECFLSQFSSVVLIMYCCALWGNKQANWDQPTGTPWSGWRALGPRRWHWYRQPTARWTVVPSELFHLIRCPSNNSRTGTSYVSLWRHCEKATG